MSASTGPRAATGALGAVQQMLQVGALITGSALLAAAHAGALARLTFVLGAMALAALAIRRSPWQYLTLTLWFWTVTPFARRLVDYYAGFEFANVMLVTPNLLTLFMLGRILRSRQFGARQSLVPGLMLLASAFYGLSVSLVRGDVIPGLVAAADWFPPLLYFFYLVELAPVPAEAETRLKHFLALNMLVVAAYGLVQYFQPQIWDIRWVLETGMTSVGVPAPYRLKPFSTLNGPGICAAWLSAQILLSLQLRTRLAMLVLPATALLLALTLVRSSMGATLLALIVALVLQRGRMARSLLLVLATVAVAAAAIPLLDSRVSDALASRFESVVELSNDGSAIARAELYQTGPSQIEAAPLGLGIGALGRGAQAAQSESLVNVDAGPVAICLALGWLGGAAYLAGIGLILAQALFVAQASGSRVSVIMAAAALGAAATLIFSNLIGFQGVILWLCAGFACAAGTKPTREAIPGGAMLRPAHV